MQFRSYFTHLDYDHGLRVLTSLNEITFNRYNELEARGVPFEHGRYGLLIAFRIGSSWTPTEMGSPR